MSSNTTLTPPSTSSTPVPPTSSVPPHLNAVIAFIIGLAIIILASILNAAGLNLTKLDHVRTSAIPKASRRRDWLRPLWLLGMLLYILSQLIGSTLALQYMRAEYVAPLGSTSLVFNFLFARFLVGTPVTSTDIYGTIVVILGVIGIVAFGSINTGLAKETDVDHITHLWRRGGWLGFFFFMTFALILLILFTSKLDTILASRSDISAIPFSGRSGAGSATLRQRDHRPSNKVIRAFGAVHGAWQGIMTTVVQLLEMWTESKDDKTIAWTLGIGWACAGGDLAGGTLVFAKATVNLLSGSLSHENPGNQFGHAAPVFTIILLVMTAVMQIVCLNRGLKVYDSTLVVPVFYGVYTATGFLNSLIFNDSVDAYAPWTLFLIFASILILVSGVVLLTHKKPEPGATPKSAGLVSASMAMRRRMRRKKNKNPENEDEEAGTPRTPRTGNGEEEVLWAVGDASDDDDDYEESDEDIDHHQHPLNKGGNGAVRSRVASSSGPEDGEAAGLMVDSEDEDNRDRRKSVSWADRADAS